MDDPLNHGADDPQDTKDDPKDTNADEGGATPADTKGGEPKNDAEEAKAAQTESWLKKLESGERKLSDMPANLGWMKKDKAFDKYRDKEVGDDDLDSRVDKAFKKRQDKEDLALLNADLEEKATPEQLSQFNNEYDQLISDGATPLRATITARRLVGLADSQTVIAERRKKGMLLPPRGTKNRQVVGKEKMTEIEQKLGEGVPKGFKPKK